MKTTTMKSTKNNIWRWTHSLGYLTLALTLLPVACATNAEAAQRWDLHEAGVEFEFIYPADEPRRSALRRGADDEEIPAQWNSQALGYMTPVKNQGKNGICWAFAMNGALEASLRKSLMDMGERLEGNYPDFSEQHMVYATFNGSLHTNPTNGWERPENKPGSGANQVFAAAYYMRGTDFGGVVNETEDSYDNPWAVLPDRASSITASKEKSYTVQNILYLTGKEKASADEVNAIKRSIMAHGAVEANMKWLGTAVSAGGQLRNTIFYNAEHAAYYSNVTSYPNSSGAELLTGHALVIVGWDDTYPVANFNERVRPTKPGAWLVKSSWGETTTLTNGMSGYLWISYEDVNFPTHVTCFDGATPFDGHEKVYETDYKPLGTSRGLDNALMDGSNATYFARVFRSERDEQLTSVRVFMTQSNLDVSVDCVTDFSYDVSEESADWYEFPEYSDFSSRGAVQTTYPGWYTIGFDTPVELTQGNDFAVIVRVENNGEYNVLMGTDEANGLADSLAFHTTENYFNTHRIWAKTNNNYSIKAVTLSDIAVTVATATHVEGTDGMAADRWVAKAMDQAWGDWNVSAAVVEGDTKTSYVPYAAYTVAFVDEEGTMILNVVEYVDTAIWVWANDNTQIGRNDNIAFAKDTASKEVVVTVACGVKSGDGHTSADKNLGRFAGAGSGSSRALEAV